MPQLRTIQPGRHQPPLPLERFIVAQSPANDGVSLDVLIIGGGPAGLSAAIRLAQHCKRRGVELEIGVLEKAAALGGHCLSGAVINPKPLTELFPDESISALPLRGEVRAERVYLLSRNRAFRIPTPPTMRNRGNHVASICEVVRWLGERAEALGVHVMTGYPAASLLVRGEAVIGARTTPSGLKRDGSPGSDYQGPTDVAATVTILAEGTRGSLTQAYLQWRQIPSPNPQIYALGVKELWQVKRPLAAVIHTMLWPLSRDTFGGSWLYPMGDDLISLGLVVGLDYPSHSTDVHELLQRFKTHPLVRDMLEGGTLIEWGAKTIPEGGFHSLPQRLSGAGVLIVGDAAGFVEVASLKGIHYAMHSGILAADAAFEALAAGNADASLLLKYDQAIAASFIRDDLYRRRNMRLGFKSGFVRGGLKAALATLTGGALPRGRFRVSRDVDVERAVTPDAAPNIDKAAMSKVDAVFLADNSTRDDVPPHLLPGPDITREVGEFYQHMCPAGVYEWKDGRLVINAPNCIDCKATDVLGPRWTPREGGSGPGYRRM